MNNSSDFWSDRHKTPPKCIAHISKESVYLLSNSELVALLKRKGVDVTRKTKIAEDGSVYYIS